MHTVDRDCEFITYGRTVTLSLIPTWDTCANQHARTTRDTKCLDAFPVYFVFRVAWSIPWSEI